jgi:hypothetical protein
MGPAQANNEKPLKLQFCFLEGEVPGGAGKIPGF